MDNKGKEKSFATVDEINTLLQGDAHVRTPVELALQLKLSVSTLKTIVMNSEEIEKSYIQCGPSSKQWKSLKHSPLKELESTLAALFKQVCERDDPINGTHLKEILSVAAHLGIPNSSASSGMIDKCKRRYNTLQKLTKQKQEC
jgi:hypothetical protein